MSVKGEKELLKKFKQLDEGVKGRVLEAAVLSGALIIQNDAIRRVPKVSHTLERSIHTEITESSNDRVVAEIGTDVVYAARVEFGYTDTDKLGRSYHQPAKPYLRPAFDENQNKARDEIIDALEQAIANLV